MSPGGHLHAGEEPHQGVLRELLEETGLEGKIVDLLRAPNVDTPGVKQLPAPFCVLAEPIPASSREGEHRHIDFIYVVAVRPADALALCEEEVDGARWFAAQELPEVETFENVRQVCLAISALSKRSLSGASSG